MNTPLSYVTAPIIDAARTRLSESAEAKAPEEELAALESKLNQVSPDLAEEAVELVLQMGAVRGEAMFMEGWRLRGNPDAMFALPDPE